MNHLKAHILQTVKPGETVLDLGSGKFFKELEKKGAVVTPIDKKLGLSIEDWLAQKPTGKWHTILLLNVVQFMKKDYVIQTLLPALPDLLVDGGRIVIATFSNDPLPAFHNYKLSFYTLDDLMKVFPVAVSPTFMSSSEEFAEGLDGKFRVFSCTRFIGVKNYGHNTLEN